jgi:uncharacterized protein
VTVVVNTSPLILLAKIGQLDLLARLYSEVIVPDAVWPEPQAELQAKPGHEAQQIEGLIQGGVFHRRQASSQHLSRVSSELGRGEQEAIALAIQLQAGLVILDDQEGRRIARQESLPITGTIGVLIEAREKGLLPSIRHELDRLIEAGMWLDELFYHRILQEFGE